MHRRDVVIATLAALGLSYHPRAATPAGAAPTPAYLPLTGGTLTGSLHLRSSFAGGENRSDSTSRVVLESHQRADRMNEAGDYAHFGEGIRLRLMRANAKNMIAWQDAFTDPARPRTVAWVGAHELPNDEEEPPHRHWSVEVTDAGGDLRTRLEVPYGRDWTNIRTSRADLTVGNGGTLRVASTDGPMTLELSRSSSGGEDGRRWRIEADDASEGGSNAGSDLRVRRYSDDGDPIADAVVVRRATGVVAIGDGGGKEGRLHVREHGSRHTIHAEQETTASTPWSLYSGTSARSGNRALDLRVRGDVTARFTMAANGAMEWGPGGSAPRDTTLYRRRADRLSTDDDFEVTEPGRGVILTSPNGSRFRLRVNDNGTLSTTLVDA